LTEPARAAAPAANAAASPPKKADETRTPAPPRELEETITDSKDSKDENKDPIGLSGMRLAGGKYVVCEYVGRTSAAWVYKAIHQLLSIPCFLKAAEVDPNAQDGVPERLRREARATAAIRHQGVLRVIDAGISEGRAYLTQEWAEGPSLRSIIDQHRVMSVPDLIAIGLELLDAVAACHKRNVVVRAFEPERIFIRTTGARPVPAFFDLSRAVIVGESGPAPTHAERTRRGMGYVIKNARYVSPEEITEQPPDPRSDLYSFGVLLYELVTGEFPYATKGKSQQVYLVSHLRDVPRPIELPRSSGVPQDLNGVIAKLLAKKPEDRFPTAEAAKHALEDTVVPDLLRHSTRAGQRVLEAWKSRVKLGLQSTAALSPIELDK
jgi:serine/threonine-protein kinase